MMCPYTDQKLEWCSFYVPQISANTNVVDDDDKTFHSLYVGCILMMIAKQIDSSLERD